MKVERGTDDKVSQKRSSWAVRNVRLMSSACDPDETSHILKDKAFWFSSKTATFLGNFPPEDRFLAKPEPHEKRRRIHTAALSDYRPRASYQAGRLGWKSLQTKNHWVSSVTSLRLYNSNQKEIRTEPHRSELSPIWLATSAFMSLLKHISIGIRSILLQQGDFIVQVSEEDESL